MCRRINAEFSRAPVQRVASWLAEYVLYGASAQQVGNACCQSGAEGYMAVRGEENGTLNLPKGIPFLATLPVGPSQGNETVLPNLPKYGQARLGARFLFHRRQFHAEFMIPRQRWSLHRRFDCPRNSRPVSAD
jgi:hypothetical protein